MYVVHMDGSCKKTVKLIKMPFGALTLVDPRNHALDRSRSDKSIRSHEG